MQGEVEHIKQLLANCQRRCCEIYCRKANRVPLDYYCFVH